MGERGSCNQQISECQNKDYHKKRCLLIIQMAKILGLLTISTNLTHFETSERTASYLKILYLYSRWSSLPKIWIETKSWDNLKFRSWDLYILKSADYKCRILARRTVNFLVLASQGFIISISNSKHQWLLWDSFFLWIGGKIIQVQHSVDFCLALCKCWNRYVRPWMK